MNTMAQALTNWFSEHKRPFPWRQTNNPYPIWVSEIMLQQTRADQMVPYFERFMEDFPSIYALDNASMDQLLKLWEGLGYYRRARLMKACAHQIVSAHNGQFPADYTKLRALPGLGDYTAAALASLAFEIPKGVVDGNVLRVVARHESLPLDVKKKPAKRAIQQFMDELVCQNKPSIINQAVMELGATICTPRNPRCNLCPLQRSCSSFLSNRTEDFPIVSKKPAIPHHDIVVGVIRRKNQVLVAKRPEMAMLGGLWEFPGGKSENNETLEESLHRELHEELGLRVAIGEPLPVIRHAYTHFRISLHGFWCSISSGSPSPHSATELRWADIRTLAKLAFPRANRKLTNAVIQVLKSADTFPP